MRPEAAAREWFMSSTKKNMAEFRRQLGSGSIQAAYRALLSDLTSLRGHFKNKYPDWRVSNLYQGRLDISFFTLIPPALDLHHLKIAVIFHYEKFHFEAWLVGRNRAVQRRSWELFKDGRWPAYRVVTPGKGIDSILEWDLTPDIDLDDPDHLTATIEAGIAAFAADIEGFLAGVQPPG